MKLGRYQLDEFLASSPDCLWYRASDEEQQTAVEVGVLQTADCSEEHRGRIFKRLQAARLIHSSNVRAVRHLSLDTQPGYLVVEWRDGPTLLERLGEPPASSRDAALDIASQLAAGLSACHRVGLVQFGLGLRHIRARQQNELPGQMSAAWTIDPTGWLRGGETAEQDRTWAPALAPEADRATAASDVYAFAGLLHWMLCGQPAPVPSPGETLAASPPHSLPSEIWDLLCQMLSADPSQRPLAEEVAAKIAAVLAGLRAAEMTIPADIVATQNTAGAAAAAAVELPEQLGRFKVLDKLGEGGMGAVYRGQDLADESTVALKVIRAVGAGSEQQRQRFLKEARLLSQVDSAEVAKLLEFNSDQGVDYLVIEFVPGQSLGDWLRQHGKLNEAAALLIASDIARGLAGAHQNGIVHRDIKPDNVLLTAAGSALLAGKLDRRDAQPLVKVTDFGLARNEDQTESLAITQQGALLGTPLYMSPEQCFGRATDARSDVYSLGATLFHLSTGRPPFESKTQVGLMQKHCNDPPPALTQIDAALSEGLAQVVEKALAKNPDARYRDAEELLADLIRLSQGTPTSLGLHPRLPPHDSPNSLQFAFTWELTSSPAQLWPFVANTDRLNQAMGLPAANFTARMDPERGVRRFAETRIAGQKIAWEEHPFEWIEGRRMSVLREFSAGPFRWFVNVVELIPLGGGGTKLIHRVQLEPANWLGRLLAQAEVGIKARRALGRIYQQIDGYIAGGKSADPAADAFRQTPTLSHQRRKRLDHRLEQLRRYQLDPAVIDSLGQFLQSAPDQEVARIRPRAFAERFGLNEDHVLAACLHASREGLLVLLWDVLCPTCRIPADVKESLAALQNHGHCEACCADFDLDFANSIELIFRAAPEIRDVEVRTYCIGGPAFSAHAVAQVRLAANERFEMELALGDGTYRIRGPQLPFVVELHVSPRGTASRYELQLTRPPQSTAVPLLRPAAQVVTLTNDSAQEVQVRLERAASRRDAVTAADAAALPLFRELFAGEILSPGQMVHVATVTLMLIELNQTTKLYADQGDAAAFEIVYTALGDISQRIAQGGGAVVKFVGDGLLATFSDPLAAVHTALELGGSLERGPEMAAATFSIGLHRGPAMVTTLNERLDYFGATVHFVSQLLELSRAGDLVMSDALLGNPEVNRLLAERGVQTDVVPTSLVNAIVHRCPLA